MTRDVAERQQPSNFAVLGQVISWSPEGDILACVVDNSAPDRTLFVHHGRGH